MSENLIDVKVVQEFIQESRDLIEDLEPTIVELGQNENGESLNAIFRLFYNFKGSAGFLGYQNISQVGHAAETLLDSTRAGNIQINLEPISLLCQTCDFSKAALGYLEDQMNVVQEDMNSGSVELF